MSQEEIDTITAKVVSKIKQEYFLIEKTFNLDDINKENRRHAEVQHIYFIDNVTKIVCSYFEVSEEDVKSKKQHRKFVYPRFIIAKLCRELPEEPITTSVIGSIIRRDHVSVLYGIRQCESFMDNDFDFRQTYIQIKKLVNESMKTY